MLSAGSTDDGGRRVNKRSKVIAAPLAGSIAWRADRRRDPMPIKWNFEAMSVSSNGAPFRTKLRTHT
jgi:hypothetical protein